MKLEMYEEEEMNGNVIRIILTPKTPEETLLLSKLLKRIKNFDPPMFKYIGDLFEGITGGPFMELKFPICWEVKR